MWILKGSKLCKWLWELSIANVNFMRAEHCECECYESWALQMWILGELGIMNVNVMGAELSECKFYESRVLQVWIVWGLSIVNENFRSAKHWECQQIYESLALCLWYFKRPENCKCDFKRELSFAKVNYVREEHCECELYESWALQI